MSQYDICEDCRGSQYRTTPSHPQLDGKGEYGIRSPTAESSPEFRVPSPSYWDSMREEPTRYASPLERSGEASLLTRPGQSVEFGSVSPTPVRLWPASEAPSGAPRRPAWAREQAAAPPQLPSLREVLRSLESDELEQSSPAEVVEEGIHYSTFYNPPEMTVLNGGFTPPPEMALLNSAFTPPVDSAQSAPPTRGNVLSIGYLVNEPTGRDPIQ